MSINDTENISIVNNQPWSIEPAGWRDYTQLNYLEKTCFKPEDIWPFWDLIGILTLPGFVRLKALWDGHMVGFIGGERQPGRDLGWITTLAVLPAYRRHGIARALLLDCEKDLGMRTIRLSVRASNHGAIQLYASAHYKVVDRVKRYYAGGEDALVFEKIR